MKKSSFAYLVFVLINIAIAISCYFYPVSRDEFYYLEKINTPNLFQEYYLSYLLVNPRIGQFFSNLVSRNLFLEVLFGILLFNTFVSVLYLNIYRRLPDFRKAKEMQNYLWLAAFFILFINYFGELFYYTPYSTNYTLTHIFYLFYVFVISDYYLDGKSAFLKKLPYLLIIILGIFIGMSNEHVPPVLIGISFLCAFIYFIKVKKLPNFKLIVFPLSIIIGYLFLFFAPANKIKQANVGKTVLDIGFNDYLLNWIKIFKTYFYYNRELLVLIIVVSIFAMIFWNTRLKQALPGREKIVFWGLLFILPLMIVAVSPLIGPRLLFFSTSVLIVILYKLILMFKFKKYNISQVLLHTFLIIFFGMSVLMTSQANQNYEKVISEIVQKRKKTRNIELDNHLNYFTLNIGISLNRKIFLESGEEYIDTDTSEDTPIEKNLKEYFELQSIKEK